MTTDPGVLRELATAEFVHALRDALEKTP